MKSHAAALFTTFICIVFLAQPAIAADLSPVTHSGIVEAPIEDCWDAFTTKTGIESWMLPHADIELKVGGLMRTNYQADGVLGDKSTIVNKILSFQPQRMLSMQVSQAPEGFPFKRAVQSMWTVLMFEPVSPKQTRVTVTSMGFTDDEESQTMRKHFDGGNLYTLQKLQKHFSPQAEAVSEKSTAEIDGEVIHRLMREGRDATTTNHTGNEALELLRTLVGGEWIVEDKRPDGGAFRVRNIFEAAPDGKNVIGRGWFGGEDGMIAHGSTQVWCEPATGPDGANPQDCNIRFQNLNESGAVARGGVRMTGDHDLEWDWNATARDGSQERYRVNMTLDKPDEYRFRLTHLAVNKERENQQLIDLRFKRVQESPELFRKMKSVK